MATWRTPRGARVPPRLAVCSPAPPEPHVPRECRSPNYNRCSVPCAAGCASVPCRRGAGNIVLWGHCCPQGFSLLKMKMLAAPFGNTGERRGRVLLRHVQKWNCGVGCFNCC